MSMRRLVVAVALAIAAAAGWVQASPTAGRAACLDVLNLRQGALRRLEVPAAALRPGGGPAMVAPDPRLLSDPAMRAKFRALAARRPAGLDKPWRPSTRSKASAAISGTYHALVLLVDFSDQPPLWLPVRRGEAHFQNMLFSLGSYPTGSMRDWYRENSYGLFEVDGNASGGAHGWYRAPPAL